MSAVPRWLRRWMHIPSVSELMATPHPTPNARRECVGQVLRSLLAWSSWLAMIAVIAAVIAVILTVTVVGVAARM